MANNTGGAVNGTSLSDPFGRGTPDSVHVRPSAHGVPTPGTPAYAAWVRNRQPIVTPADPALVAKNPTGDASRDAGLKASVDYALQPGRPLGSAVAASRASAPGPAVSGYAALSALLGPHIAAQLPGVLNQSGQKPHSSGLGIAEDAALLLPISRGPRALIEGIRAARDADTGAKVAEGVKAARSSYEAGKGVIGAAVEAGKSSKMVARSSEEAAAHVNAVSKTWKDKGFGVKPQVPPTVEKGADTPRTGGELGATVRGALGGAKGLREQQEALRSTERGARAGKAASAMEDIGGLAGHYEALRQLKGELPKVHFGGFENLDSESVLSMINHAQQHPDLMPYEKIRTVEAITKAVAGRVPTDSEQKLLERVFGTDVANSVVKSSGWRDKVGRTVADVINLPRALEASFDLSAPFRQGLVAGVSHPVIFAKNLVPMVKAAGSEKVYKGIMDGIASRPTFPLMDKAGLAITDVHGHALSSREEMFMTRLVGKVPGLRGSERAYTGFLNKTRADIFDHLVHQAAEQGRSLEDPKLVKDIARFVNTATGRGDLGRLAPAAVALNTTLFSPRLLASRLNLLSPRYYATLDPFARKEALKAAAGLVLTMGSVLSIARAAGARVNMDPRNADFGKIRIGNTRVDLAGGFQQPIRLLAQEASGKIVSSTTGKTLTLGPSGPGKLSRWDIAERFALSKFAPVPSVLSDVLHGHDFIGQPVTVKGEASSHLIPLLWQDMYDLYKSGGVAAAAGGAVPGLFGVGLQTYSDKQKAKSGTGSGDPFGRGGNRSSSSPDPYGRGGGSSSSPTSPDPFGR